MVRNIFNIELYVTFNPLKEIYNRLNPRQNLDYNNTCITLRLCYNRNSILYKKKKKKLALQIVLLLPLCLHSKIRYNELQLEFYKNHGPW